MNFDSIGNLILNILIGAGYFVVAIVVIKDILACISKHDVEGIIRSILTGVVGYGSLFVVTKILDKVKDMMQ
jgi:uncharacterized membrane-anchored protein